MLRWEFTTLTSLLLVLLSGVVVNGSENVGGRLAIQRIEVQVMRSIPPIVIVHVHGVVLNGCTHIGPVEQHRNAQIVTITIPIYTTGEVCTMMARLVYETIRLEGRFRPGSYVVDVNGTVENFRV